MKRQFDTRIELTGSEKDILDLMMEDAVKTVRYMNRLMAHETYD